MGKEDTDKLNNFWIFARKYLPSKIDLVVCFVIVFVALRVTLLTPGYIDYTDIRWALDPHLYDSTIIYVPSLFVNGSFVSLFSMTRDFISWPYLILDYISNSMQFIERSYLFYGLYLFVVMCYIFAKLFINKFQELIGKTLTTIHYNILKHSSAIFAFSNLFAINYIVDGGFFSDDLIMIFIAIEVLAVFSFRKNSNYVALVGVLLSLTAFLDPDYYIISIISIFVALLVSMIHMPIVRIVKRFVYPVIASLPAVLLIQLTLLYPYSAPGAITEPFARSLGSVFFNGANHVWYLSIVLLGYSWSIVTYGPPSIFFLGNKISFTYGILGPTQILLPPGPVTYLWLVALYSIPVMAFFSLVFRRTRRYAIPVALLAVVGVILSVYGHISFLYRFSALISATPYIGQSIATSFSIPDHFLIIIASSYLLLFPLSLFNILVAEEERNKSVVSKFKLTFHFFRLKLLISRQLPRKANLRTKSRERKRKWLTILVILIVSLMIFANWQAFDGSFYPARSDNSYRIGNGVPNAGSFSPYNIPKSYLEAYYYIESQGRNFNVYWPIGLSAPPGNEQPLAGFPYLGEHNLSVAVAPYLEANGVKYVVVYNLENLTQPLFWPTSSVPGEFEMFFGIPTYSATLNFLNNSPGLKIAVHTSAIYVYNVENVNSFYYNSSLLLDNSSSEVPPYLYAIFDEMGFNVSFTASGNISYSYGINTTSKRVDVLSPSFMLSNIKSGELSGLKGYAINKQSEYNELTPGNSSLSISPALNLSKSNFAPFSQYLNITNGQYKLKLANMSGMAYVDVKGSGKIGNSTIVNFPNYTMVSVPFNGDLSFNGSFSVAYSVVTHGSNLTEMKGSYVIYTVGATKSLELLTTTSRYYPHITTDGYGLYLNVTGTVLHVSAPGLTYVQYIYYALLGYLFVLTIYLYKRGKDEKG